MNTNARSNITSKVATNYKTTPWIYPTERAYYAPGAGKKTD